MPLIKNLSDHKTGIYLWKYDQEDRLDINFLIEPENRDRVKNYHPSKLLEMLMIRKMLKNRHPNSKILYRDGEPYLFPRTEEISITHSFPYAAIAFSENRIGIDIERSSPKILRVKDKFICPKETEFIPKEEEVRYLTIIWSIKESLYKMHHSKYWSLKRHYEVFPFSIDTPNKIRCRVHDETISDEFYARVKLFQNYVFTIVD
ncbi:MAG: 4-phosphopantetheinyl transferase family protein [Bergeyella sp.]|nr:4-phosphopantetheinyl transferase family protein [Bergeyella sp.]